MGRPRYGARGGLRPSQARPPRITGVAGSDVTVTDIRHTQGIKHGWSFFVSGENGDVPPDHTAALGLYHPAPPFPSPPGPTPGRPPPNALPPSPGTNQPHP